MAYILFGLAAVLFIIIYLYKTSKTESFHNKALEAVRQGDDSMAIQLFKEALLFANENPETELKLISEMEKVYSKHNATYDFSNYETLINQTRSLNKRSTEIATKELEKVIELKAKLIEKMPDL